MGEDKRATGSAPNMKLLQEALEQAQRRVEEARTHGPKARHQAEEAYRQALRQVRETISGRPKKAPEARSQAPEMTKETVRPELMAEGQSLEAPGDAFTIVIKALKELQDTNMQLAGQLGAAHERVRTLENEVKLLTTGKQPWWSRIFRKSA